MEPNDALPTPEADRRQGWLLPLLAALLCTGFAALWWGATSGGLTADFGFVDGAGQRQSVVTQPARRLWYRNAADFLPPYLAGWDSERWGFPAAVPALDVRWSGVLELGSAEPLELEVAADGEWRIELGELTLAGRGDLEPQAISLPAGLLPVAIEFRSSTANPHFALQRAGLHGRSAPLPGRFHASPDAASAARSARWLGGLLLLAAGAALASGRLRRSVAAGPWRAVALVLLTLLAFGLRADERSATPHHNRTADEYFHLWAGWNLVHGEKPTAWSWDRHYRGRMVDWFGSSYRMVTPWVDHPPLLPVLVGSWSLLESGPAQGADAANPFTAPPLAWARLAPIGLAALATPLVALLAARLFSWPAGLAAALLYATTPWFVGLHRLVKEDNVLAPLVLATVWLALSQRDAPRRWKLALIAAACALTPLLKLTAVFLPAAAAALLVFGDGSGTRRWRDALAPAAGLGVGGALLLAFAAWVDWGVFWGVTGSMGSKPTGFRSGARLLLEPNWVYREFGRGWAAWIWIGALPHLLARARPLAWFCLPYLLILAAGAHHANLFGWYLLPVYPLLLGAAAEELVGSRRSTPSLFLFWLLFLATSLAVWSDATGELLLGVPPRLFWLFCAGVLLLELAPTPAWLRGRSERLHRGLAWGSLAAAAAINVLLVSRMVPAVGGGLGGW